MVQHGPMVFLVNQISKLAFVNLDSLEEDLQIVELDCKICRRKCILNIEFLSFELIHSCIVLVLDLHDKNVFIFDLHTPQLKTLKPTTPHRYLVTHLHAKF